MNDDRFADGLLAHSHLQTGTATTDIENMSRETAGWLSVGFYFQSSRERERHAKCFPTILINPLSC